LAARFILSDFTITKFDDINFEFENFRFCIQCKRPQGGSSLGRNIEDAYDQLKTTMFQKDSRGLIAISVEKVLDIDDKVLPISGSAEIETAVDVKISDFVIKHNSTWASILHKNVLALLPVFRFISMLEPRRIPVATYFICIIPLFPGGVLNYTNDLLLRKMAAKLKVGIQTPSLRPF
jgi:hypothetical protein